MEVGIQIPNNYHNSGLNQGSSYLPFSYVQENGYTSNINRLPTTPQNGVKRLFNILDLPCDSEPYSSPTTNGKTVDILFSPVISTTSNNDKSSNNKTSVSVNSIKTSSKMPEPKNSSNTWRPPSDHGKHRQQNGTSKYKRDLLQNIQKAVQFFCWDSGYVHKNHDSVYSSLTSYRRYDTGQYFHTPFYRGYSCMPLFYNPNRHCSQPLQKYPPSCVAPVNPAFRKTDYPGSNYKIRDDGMSLKRPQNTNISKNNFKLFTSDKRKKLFQKTHWFREPAKTKVKNTRFDTPNRTEMYNNVTRAMSPVISNQTLPSTCNPQKTNCNNTKEIGILPLARAATSGDLAANSCQISLSTQMQVCKQNENYSCSDFYGSTDSSDSGFAFEYHENDYGGNLEPNTFSDEAEEKFNTVPYSLSPKIPGPSFSEFSCSDVESTDLDSDDDDDKIQLTSSEDSDDDLEIVEINPCLYSSWLISPSSDDSTDFSQDEDDDWDTTWSAASTELKTVSDELYLMSEFNPYTIKFANCCTLSSKEKVDVPDVEADYGIHQRLKEANERWNEVYYDDYDLDFKKNYTPKVQFATGKKLTTCHLLFCWTYAYKAARISPWITLALDSQRFQKRIEELKPTIDPVLDPVHRQNVFNSRLQQGAESM